MYIDLLPPHEERERCWRIGLETAAITGGNAYPAAYGAMRSAYAALWEKNQRLVEEVDRLNEELRERPVEETP